MTARLLRAALAILFPMAIACSEGDPTGTFADEEPDLADLGDPMAGAVAFQEECAGCHASGDGFDLAFFAFTDTTIIRRAVGHVDTTTAFDIVAHISSLPVREEDRDVRMFQPGDRVLPSDMAFALELFGADQWPAGLGSSGLLAIDPLGVAAAVPLPLWSVEEGNTDWMPDTPLPDHILDTRGQLPRALIAGYRAAPTEQNLILTTQVLRGATVLRDSPDAPCFTNEPERADYQVCFEAQRWISTLGVQHMIRYGLSTSVHPALHDVWWDVGMTVRRAIVKADIDFENGFENWASWMYLGWIFEPSRHASTYTAQGLANLGLERHATFVALRSQVARGPRSFAVYADPTTTARHAPPHWTLNALSAGYRHTLERIESGDLPRVEDQVEARRRIEASYVIAARKLPMADRERLGALALEVLEAFDGATGRD